MQGLLAKKWLIALIVVLLAGGGFLLTRKEPVSPTPPAAPLSAPAKPAAQPATAAEQPGAPARESSAPAPAVQEASPAGKVTPAALSASTSTPAGEVTKIRGLAFSQGTENRRVLGVGDKVFPGERITTGQKARLVLKMVDQAIIALGEDTEFKIKEYHFSAEKESGKGLLEVTRGFFKATSGGLAKVKEQPFHVATPVATMGVRGSTMWGEVVPSQGDESTPPTLNAMALNPIITVSNGSGEVMMDKPFQTTTANSPTNSPEAPRNATSTEVNRAEISVAVPRKMSEQAVKQMASSAAKSLLDSGLAKTQQEAEAIVAKTLDKLVERTEWETTEKSVKDAVEKQVQAQKIQDQVDKIEGNFALNPEVMQKVSELEGQFRDKKAGLEAKFSQELQKNLGDANQVAATQETSKVLQEKLTALEAAGVQSLKEEIKSSDLLNKAVSLAESQLNLTPQEVKAKLSAEVPSATEAELNRAAEILGSVLSEMNGATEATRKELSALLPADKVETAIDLISQQNEERAVLKAEMEQIIQSNMGTPDQARSVTDYLMLKDQMTALINYASVDALLTRPILVNDPIFSQTMQNVVDSAVNQVQSAIQEGSTKSVSELFGGVVKNMAESYQPAVLAAPPPAAEAPPSQPAISQPTAPPASVPTAPSSVSSPATPIPGISSPSSPSTTPKSSGSSGGSAIKPGQTSATSSATNRAPVVAGAIANQSWSGSGNKTFQVPVNTFSDPDGDTLTYAATLGDGSPLPAWLSFIPATRTFSGNPSASVGNVTLKVSVDDGKGGTVSNSFTLSVSAANDVPTVANPLTNQNWSGSGTASFQVPANTFNDADGDALTYTAAQGSGAALPAWIAFAPATRTFTGSLSTAPFDGGTLTLAVTANDGHGGTASGSFALTYVSANQAPSNLELSNNWVGIDSEQGAVVGSLSSIDPDNSGPYLYDLVAPFGSAQGRFAIGGASGSQLVVADPAALAQFDGTSNTHQVTVRVTDLNGNGRSFSKDFRISVVRFSGTDQLPGNVPSSSSIRSNAHQVISTLRDKLKKGQVAELNTADITTLLLLKADQQMSPGGGFSHSLADILQRFQVDLQPTVITLTGKVGLLDAIYSRLPTSLQGGDSASGTTFDAMLGGLTGFNSDYAASVRLRVTPVISGTSLGFDPARSYLDVLHEASYLPNYTFTLEDLMNRYNQIRGTFDGSGLRFFTGSSNRNPSQAVVTLVPIAHFLGESLPISSINLHAGGVTVTPGAGANATVQ
ncbi:MAG: putative Ig domain-containing protein [Magnetococcales bacterium]|nr:putative Ig domain-containing protein [Magnetococcales bacterium]